MRQDSGPKKATDEPGLVVQRMSARPHKGKNAPDLLGTYYKYTLEKLPVDFLVADPVHAGSRSTPEPFLVMHMQKQARAVAVVPTTAVDDAYTPTDASSSGALPRGSETTPDRPDSPEEVTGLIERLNLAGAASPAAASSASSCAYCGKQGEEFKRCSACKRTWYCGAKCQKAGWKKHKNTCSPLSLQDVWTKMRAAEQALDWRGVLKWEWRMEELLENGSDEMCNLILQSFGGAHTMNSAETGLNELVSLHIAELEMRRVDFLGKISRFRDQGEAMITVSEHLRFADKDQESVRYLPARTSSGWSGGATLALNPVPRTLNLKPKTRYPKSYRCLKP